MPHFAKIDENNIVTQVIVIDQETLNTGHWGDIAQWVQTSYNTRGGVHYGPNGEPDGGVPLRKNFAGPGYTYDPFRDAFVPPQPYASWTLDEETCWWKAPVPQPNDGKFWSWDENSQSWKELILPESQPQ